MIFSAGTEMDHYRLLASVASGSCGMVWQAENIISGELEALKTLSSGPLAERELRALKLYREINHPALIRVRHIGRVENVPFYTMDWCESSLAERKVSAVELLDIAQILAGGLAELHAHGLLHRDIKPANIFFRQGKPVLGDIGLLTKQKEATFAGTPGFLSPDILRGKVSADCYSDCYALAKSIYCALSGLGPEQFPLYKGEMTREASLLMRAVIAVCSESPSIRTPEELLHFLAAPEKPRRGHRFYLWAVLLCLLITGGTAGGMLMHKKAKKPVPQALHIPPTDPVRDQLLRHPPPESVPAENVRPDRTGPKDRLFSEKRSDAVARLKKRNSALDRDPIRAEILKKMMSPSTESQIQLHTLQQEQKAYNIISNFSTGKLPILQEYEENLIRNMLPPAQRKIFLQCSGEIRKIQSSKKWSLMTKHWKNAEYPSQLRKLKLEKNLDSMSALRQIAARDPALAVLMKQSECHHLWRSVRNQVLQHASPTKAPAPDIASTLDLFTQATAEYSKAFYRQ